jgi:hypothetical protein
LKSLLSIRAIGFLFIFLLDCLSIVIFFDQIEDIINTILDEVLKVELMYDFNMVRDTIVQLMAHRLRAAQQEKQKKLYIDQIDENTAFLTVDWSQKILPQQFREGQSLYFGKRGMSLLVGSFVLKESSYAKELDIIL